MKKVGSIGLVFVFLLIASNAFADSVTLTDPFGAAVSYRTGPAPPTMSLPTQPVS